MAYFFELSDIQSTFDGQIVTLYGDITRVDVSSGAGESTFDLSNPEHMVTISMLDPLPVKVGMHVQVHNLIAIRHSTQALPVYFFATTDSYLSENIIAPTAIIFPPRNSTMPPPMTASYTQESRSTCKMSDLEQANSKSSKCCDAPEDMTCKRTGALHQAVCFVCRRVIKEDQPFCSKQTGMVKCTPHVAVSLPPSPFKEKYTHACDADAPPPKVLKFTKDDDTEEEDPFQQPGHNVKF